MRSHFYLRQAVLLLCAAALLACLLGQSCEPLPVFIDQYPERPELKLSPMTGRSVDEAIQLRKGESAALAVTVEGGQGPYFVTFDFKDGSEPFMTPANLLVSPPLAATDHKFDKAGLFAVGVSVRDLYERTAFTEIYVRVQDTTQAWQSAHIAVDNLACVYRLAGEGSPSTWDTWAQGPSASDMSGTSVQVMEEWNSDEGSYTEDAFGFARFEASWNRPTDTLEYGNPSEGHLEVAFDRKTLMVTSFQATKTVTVPLFGGSQRVQTTTISGSGVQLRLALDYSPPLLFGELTGQAACTAITSVTDEYVEGDRKSVLVNHACGDDSRLTIVLYPYVLPW